MGGTSGKLFLKSAPSFSIMKVFICSLLVAGASCLPAADPQLLYHAAPVPVLYHHNCTNVEETITTKSCVPKVEEECEDVEVPAPKIVVEDNCRNITVSQCGLKPVEAGEAETLPEEEGVASVEKREAEADPLLLYGAAPLLPAAPVVPLLKHVCDEIQQEYCYPETKVVEDTTNVKRCVFKNTVECTDVEHKIPKTICEPVAALPAAKNEGGYTDVRE